MPNNRTRCMLVLWDAGCGYFRYEDGSPVLEPGAMIPSRSKFDLPDGAMWYADSGHVAPGRTNPCLYVKCGPSRTGSLCIWNIDGQAYGPDVSGRRRYYGDGWKRTGRPPAVTVTPSINFPSEYHGVLTDGWLIEV